MQVHNFNESQLQESQGPPQRQLSKRRSYAYKKDLEEAVNDTSKADSMQALKYKKKWTIRHESGDLFPLTVDNEEFSESGVGLQLFFDFIKYATITFFIMAIIATVPMYSNYTGDGLQNTYGSYTFAQTKFSIANQPQLEVKVVEDGASDSEVAEIQAFNELAVNKFVDEMGDRENYVIIPDVAYTVVFLLFIIFWSKKSKKIKLAAEDLNVTPSVYTVYFTGIHPRTTGDDIRTHFERKFGKIVEIRFVRDFQGTLTHFQNIAEIQDELDKEDKRLQIQKDRSNKQRVKLYKKLVKEEKNLKEVTGKKFTKNLKEHEHDAIGVYIVFNEESSKKECVKHFKESQSVCGTTSELQHMKGHKIKLVQRVDEPANLQWENMDLRTSEKVQRRCVMITLIICVMFLTFAVIFIANIVKPTNYNNCPTSEITFEEAQAGEGNSYIVDCYCRQISPAQIYSDPEQKKFCYDTYLKYAYLLTLTVATALVIAIVNYILKIILRSLGKYSRYPTISAETEGITLSLFLSMFINTAILTLLLQADIFGFQPAITISKPIPPLAEQQDSNAQEFSADFDRSWYMEVGGKITYTMGFFILFPHFFYLMALPYFRCQRKKKLKKAIIQRDMNENIVGPEFSVTQYYAIVLNTIFTTLFYCSGIPLLLWFAAFSLLIQYWVYKYMILRYNKRPPSYDHKLNKEIGEILPWAVVFHLMIGIYMYGSPLIFPDNSDQVKNAVQDNFEPTSGATDLIFSNSSKSINEIEARTNRQVYMFALLIIVAFVWIIKTFVWDSLRWMFRKTCGGQKKESIQDMYEFHPYETEYANINKKMLASYDVRVNPKYAKLIQAMDDFTYSAQSNQSQGNMQVQNLQSADLES